MFEFFAATVTSAFTMSAPSTSQVDQNNETQEPIPNAQNFGDLTLPEAVNLLNVYVNIITQQSKQLQKCDELRIYDQNVKQAQQQHITHLCKVVEGCKCNAVPPEAKNALKEVLKEGENAELQGNDRNDQQNENPKCEPVQVTLEHLDKYPILDTAKLTQDLVNFLEAYQINLEEYAESCLGIPRESAAAFFESPTPWILLTFSERAPFIRIKMFLEEVESVKNSTLDPANVPNPPELVENGQVPLPDPINNIFPEPVNVYRLNNSENQLNMPSAPPVEPNFMQTRVMPETADLIRRSPNKKRRRVEAREQAIIMAEYEKNGKPSGKRKAELAKELNLSVHTVKKWFDKVEQAKLEEAGDQLANLNNNFNVNNGILGNPNNLNLLTQLQNFPNFAYYLPPNIARNFQ